MFNEDHYQYFNVRVFQDGMVEWIPGGSFQSKCDVDIRLFPFDDQVIHSFHGSYHFRTYSDAQE